MSAYSASSRYPARRRRSAIWMSLSVAAAGIGLGITMGFGIVIGFGIAISLGIIGAGAGLFAATIAFTGAFALAVTFAFALTFFFGAARFATFLAALRTTRAFFLTVRLLLERVFDARILAFATGRFLDFLFFAMVRLLLTGQVDTRV